MKKKKRYLAAVLIFLFLPIICQAAILSKVDCIESGNCQLNHFIVLALSVWEFVLGLVGALALGAFIYGGVLLLLSAGSSDRVKKGQQVLVGAVIGLIIVFSSYLIIQTILEASGVIDEDGTFKEMQLDGKWDESPR